MPDEIKLCQSCETNKATHTVNGNYGVYLTVSYLCCSCVNCDGCKKKRIIDTEQDVVFDANTRLQIENRNRRDGKSQYAALEATDG